MTVTLFEIIAHSCSNINALDKYVKDQMSSQKTKIRCNKGDPYLSIAHTIPMIRLKANVHRAQTGTVYPHTAQVQDLMERIDEKDFSALLARLHNSQLVSNSLDSIENLTQEIRRSVTNNNTVKQAAMNDIVIKLVNPCS